MTNTEIQTDALNRATYGNSLSNFPAIYAGFSAKGIPESEIKPRENIFSYQAWRALGRQVRRGEKGVRIPTFRKYKKVVKNSDGSEKTVMKSGPGMVSVFHISQTDLISDDS